MGEESAAAVSVDRTQRKIFPSPKAAPWLVIPYGKGTSRDQGFYNICEPNNTTCRKSIPELVATRYIQQPSHQGWLIVLCHDEEYEYPPDYSCGNCFLWNPTTSETIHLPNQLKWSAENSGYWFVDCVLSSPPGGDDSMVLFVFTDAPIDPDDEGINSLVFIYCCPGDQIWRKKKWHSETNIRVESLCCFKGKFYVMCFDERNLEIEKQKRADGSIKLCIRTIEVRNKDSYPLVGGLYNRTRNNVYVATDDELYCIATTCPSRGCGKVVTQIVVLRLDFSAMAWDVVHSIGDHVLFIGTYTTACCSAAKMGISGGCLYLTFPGDQSLYKFDIESTGNSVIKPCSKLPKPRKNSDFIMMPKERKRKRKREENSVGDQDEGKESLIQAVMMHKTDVVRNHNIRDFEKACPWGILNEDMVETTANLRDFEKACPWGILNEDMVETIANLLHRLDYIHLRSVCKAFRALLPLEKLTSVSTTRDTYLSPWLMFSRDHSNTTFNFINPMHNNENYLLKHSDLVRTVIRFQKGGWLLVSMENNEYGLFFYNPFTRETIKLPELPVKFIFSGVSFSSLPTSPDCVVFAIDQYNDDVILYFIRKGETFWRNRVFCNTDTEVYTPSHNTPVFFNGVLYCADYNGKLSVFDLVNDSWKVLEKPNRKLDAIYPSFLVECGGELLLVKLGRLGKLFGIFRLEFSTMHWVQINNLRNHMLFVSYTSCFSAVAPNSRMENKVYFPRLCTNGEGVLFYCLETDRYRSFGSQHSSSNFTDTEGWYSNCTWIQPNWSKSAAQDLVWIQPNWSKSAAQNLEWPEPVFDFY